MRHAPKAKQRWAAPFWPTSRAWYCQTGGLVEAMVAESGDPRNFAAHTWTARWLAESLPALGGVRPADLMDTMEGQNVVASALMKMQRGAYA